MVSGVSGADSLFAALNQQPAQMDALAQSATSSGIRYYQEGKYDIAIREFKRAVSLSPQSENAVNAYNFLATAFIKVGDSNGAVKAYQSALRLAPNQEDLHQNLGNIFFDQGNADQAIEEFKKAVHLNPASTTNFYSLGQAYLAKGSLNDAMSQFEKIIKLAPGEYGGYYGMGQTYYRAGEYEKAIEQFNKVIDLKGDFAYARLDLGYALVDLGRVDEAYEQANILQDTDLSLAAILNNYIYQTAKPEFLIAYSDTGFYPTLGPKTALSVLDSYLSSPNASEEFTMKFIFNKTVDIASVENPYNWRITRATLQIEGGPYNWGMPIPSSEINISLFPERVNYDFQSNTAVVTFRLTQNDLGNGTLDPSHIVFQFLGQDAYGNRMNPAADQYSGLSKIV